MIKLYTPQILLDGKPVEKITAFLFPKGGNENPKTLLANAGKSFQGSIVLGMGFTFDDTNDNATPIATMHQLIAENPKNQDRIFPYIGGEEVNSSPTHSHHRYVINFGEMSEDEAREYLDLMAIVEEKVKPKRLQDNRASYRNHWWQYAEKRVDLMKAIVQCDRVLVISRVGQHCAFSLLQSGLVYSESLVIFPFQTYSAFCTLQSRLHEIWARFFGSSLEDRLRYTPSDGFETFPFPEGLMNEEVKSEKEENTILNSAFSILNSTGEAYYTYRAQLIINNNQRLTTTYNRFHDPQETDPAILKLRELHSKIDQAVLSAYGWHDIDTTCEFILDYEEEEDTTSNRKKPYRYRWPQVTHDEVLARLLDLNQKRYEQEISGGTSKGGKKKGEAGKKKAIKPNTSKGSIPQTDKQIELIPGPIEQLDVWSHLDS